MTSLTKEDLNFEIIKKHIIDISNDRIKDLSYLK